MWCQVAHHPSSMSILLWCIVMWCQVAHHPSSMSSLTILFVRNTGALLPNFLWQHYNFNNFNNITLHYNYNYNHSYSSITLHFATPHYILQLWVRWPLQRLQKWNRPSIHQWIRFAHASQQLTSPIISYLWNLRRSFVRHYWYIIYNKFHIYIY